jgi:methionyl-tRNA synthetase
VNAKPHIGHALEFVQADAYVRARKQLGDDVYFLAGTDDNALKNVQAAEAAGEEVSAYVDRHAEVFQSLHRELGVSIDDFIRTSNKERHFKGAQKLWSACRKEDIYKKSYKGLYCLGCEEFKTDKDLIEGECPEHPGKKLQEIEEENYFFKLSNYQDKLLELIESDKIQIVPEIRKNEITSFIKSGLEDFSISRSYSRAKGWGVPVPGDESQVMYVWFDALANYITALGYADEGPLYKKWWVESDERIHAIGKGINRFHTVYWPAMLLSAGLPLPTTVFVHGYLTVDGQKMSKTLGNVIDPFDIVNRYGSEAFRYFFLRHVHPYEDTDFTEDRFKEAFVAGLSNGIGNLTSRLLKLSETHLPTPIVVPTLQSSVQEVLYRTSISQFEFHKACETIWQRIQVLDEWIAKDEPFKVLKTDNERGLQMLTDMLGKLVHIALLLEPFLPETSKKVLSAIASNKKPDNLFPRI